MRKFLQNVNWLEVHESWMEPDNFYKFNQRNMLEQCRWCGRDFYEQMDPVIEEGGEKFEDYYESDPKKDHYHTDCWKRRQLAGTGQRRASLSDF